MYEKQCSKQGLKASKGLEGSLQNYREHRFKLWGKTVYIAAMARPGYHGKSETECFAALREKYSKMPKPLIIGLNEEHRYYELATQYGFDYISIGMPDAFEKRKRSLTQAQLNEETKVESEIYEHVYNEIQKAVDQMRPVILHCGAGHGRSGTTLAALKMHELMEEPDFVTLLSSPDTQVKPSHERSFFSCSEFIKLAIIKTRQEISSPETGNAHKCVEYKEELQNLERYEIYLLKECTSHPNPEIASAARQALSRYKQLPPEPIPLPLGLSKVTDLSTQGFFSRQAHAEGTEAQKSTMKP